MPDKPVLTNSSSVSLDEFSFRRSARHNPARAVHGREKRFAGYRRVDPFNDDRIIAHASSDEAFLPWERWCCSFPDNPKLLAGMFLAPREVVMIMNLFPDCCLENVADHMSCDKLPPSICVTACKRHCRNVIGSQR